MAAPWLAVSKLAADAGIVVAYAGTVVWSGTEDGFDGAEAVMWRDGDRLVIEPVRKDGLLDLLAGLPPLPDEFPDVDDTLQPLDDVEV